MTSSAEAPRRVARGVQRPAEHAWERDGSDQRGHGDARALGACGARRATAACSRCAAGGSCRGCRAARARRRAAAGQARRAHERLASRDGAQAHHGARRPAEVRRVLRRPARVRPRAARRHGALTPVAHCCCAPRRGSTEEAVSARALPEMVFGTRVELTHEASGTVIAFNALDALREWKARRVPLLAAHAVEPLSLFRPRTGGGAASHPGRLRRRLVARAQHRAARGRHQGLGRGGRPRGRRQRI
jgi:hypothetical protein